MSTDFYQLNPCRCIDADVNVDVVVVDDKNNNLNL